MLWLICLKLGKQRGYAVKNELQNLFKIGLLHRYALADEFELPIGGHFDDQTKQICMRCEKMQPSVNTPNFNILAIADLELLKCVRISAPYR